jgi:hypothetical protein
MRYSENAPQITGLSCMVGRTTQLPTLPIKLLSTFWVACFPKDQNTRARQKKKSHRQNGPVDGTLGQPSKVNKVGDFQHSPPAFWTLLKVRRS